MKNVFLSSILFFCTTFFIKAQDASLLPQNFRELTAAKTDSAKVEAYRDLCFNYSLANSDSGIYYGKLGLAIALKINFVKGIGDCYNNLGWCYTKKGDYKNAKENLLLAKKYFEKTGNACYTAVAETNLGNVYFNQSMYADALEIYLRSEKLKENCPDEGFKSSGIYSIGTIYNAQKEYGKALEYFQKANAINFANNDSAKTAECINGIGNSFLGMKMYDSALVYFDKSIKLFTAFNNINGIAFAQESIGSVLLEQKNFVKALESFESAKQNFEKLDSKSDVCYELTMIGDAYRKKGELNSAIYYQQWALQMADSNKFLSMKQMVLASLAELYSLKNDYKTAYDYFSKSIALKDSLAVNEQQEKLNELKTKYETEQKDKQIELLNKDKEIELAKAEKQKQLKNILIVGVVMLLLLALVLFNRYKLKTKTAAELAEKNEIIKKEKERAEQSEKFKQQFLANMSHEIRTPMNAIMGMTELLEDAPLEGQHKKYVDAIHRSSQNLLVIVNDILDLSKMEAGKMELENISFDVHQLIKNIHESFLYKTKEKNIEFNYTIENNVPQFIISDQARITQVLVNLIGNAVKFTKKGSVQLAVRSVQSPADFSLPTANCQLHFLILDTGIGIPTDKLEKIFDSFTQSHAGTTRKYGGTGLGLTISKNLAELFGGTISVKSEEGKGSEFSFIIPVEIGSQKSEVRSRMSETEMLSEQPQTSNLPVPPFAGKPQTLNVLLVEDNEYNRMLVIDALKKKIKNVNISIAENGKQAIEFLKSSDLRLRTPDLILLDIQMPEMDGYETASKIRSEFPSPIKGIPIIAVTASVIQSDIEKCKAAGMNDFIAKPFRIKELIEKVVEHSGKKNIEVGEQIPKVESEKSEVSNTITNLDYLHNFTEGDGEEIQKYISIFCERIPQRLADAESAIRKEDVLSVITILHSIKPLITSVGLSECETIITELEENKMEIKHNKLLPKFLQVRKFCLKAIEELKTEIKI